MRHPLRENLEITDASGTDTVCCSRCRFQYCRADQDWRKLLREGVQLGVFYRVVLPLVASQTPLPEETEDAYGLCQHGAFGRPISNATTLLPVVRRAAGD